MPRDNAPRNEAGTSNPKGPIFVDIEDECEARDTRGREGMLVHAEGQRAPRNEAGASISTKKTPFSRSEKTAFHIP